MRRVKEVSTSVIAVLLLSPGVAAADEPAALETSGATTDAGQSLDIVVTATRREERLQQVPIAVQVVSQEDFANSAYKNPSDLQYLSPSVQVSATGGVGFTVRGVGTNSYDAATEQTVGMVIDGVVYGFVDDISADLSDIERVEVLKGPQGTQFGKNASAGVINIITARPTTDRLYAVGHAAYGTFNDTNISGRVNVPITGNLAAMLVGSYQNRDGWSYNVLKDRHEGGQDQAGVKAKLAWSPTTDFDAYLSLDYRRVHIAPNFLSTYRSLGVGSGSTGPGFGTVEAGIVPGPANTDSAIGPDSYRTTKTGGGSLELNYRMGDYTITSVSALRFMNRDQLQSVGGTPIDFVTGYLDDDARQFSQELRLTSPKGGLVEFVGGLYYYNRHSKGHTIYYGPFGGLAEELYGPGASVSFSGGRDTAIYDIDSFAGFADGTLNLTDKLHLIAGGRLTYDKASSSISTQVLPDIYPLTGTVSGPGEAQTSATNFSWRLGARYELTPSIMLYATTARGYKGPLAIAVSGGGARTVKPETVRSYEVGLKTTWLGGRVLFNVTAFDEKFHNFQTSVLDTSLIPASFVLGNAGGMRTRGAEVEVAATPIRDLKLSVNGTYQDAKFTDFEASCYDPNEPIGLPTTTDPTVKGACYTIPGTSISYIQAAGRPIPNASKWNLTASASYTHPLTETLSIDASSNLMYRSKFYSNGVDPNTKVDGYATVNVNVGVGRTDGGWRIGMFVRNLFDKYFISGIEPGAFDLGATTNVLNPEARRTIGVVLDGRF